MEGQKIRGKTGLVENPSSWLYRKVSEDLFLKPKEVVDVQENDSKE